MRVEKRSGDKERQILTAMIVDTATLGIISTVWNDASPPMSSPWSNLVGQWCINFHRRYNRAPKSQIENLFASWSQRKRDKHTTQLVDDFLTGLSGEYQQLRKRLNLDYIKDQAGEYFEQVQLTKFKDALQGLLDQGDIQKAKELTDNLHHVELGVGAGINVIQDMDQMRAAFDKRMEPLIIYPGPIGRFFGNILSRDCFVGIEGPEKRGKTWILLDLAWMGMLQRRNVAFFEIGDLSQDQILRRFGVRATEHPLDPCRLKIPRKVKLDEKGFRITATSSRTFKKRLNWWMVKRASEAVMTNLRTKQPFLKLSTHPAGSVSVEDIKAILRSWELREGWRSDIIVIDYADLLANPKGKFREDRNIINANWIQMRGLSQEMHNLVLTATQTNRASYDVETISMAHTGEDKRKLAHVSAMMSLNQKKEEKEEGIMRFNWPVVREELRTVSDCCYVAGNLALARPIILSAYKKFPKSQEKNEEKERS